MVLLVAAGSAAAVGVGVTTFMDRGHSAAGPAVVTPSHNQAQEASATSTSSDFQAPARGTNPTGVPADRGKSPDTGKSPDPGKVPDPPKSTVKPSPPVILLHPPPTPTILLHPPPH